MGLDALRETARSLLVQFGKEMIFQHTDKGAYNPITGEMGADTITLSTVHGSPPKAASFVQQPGSLIHAGDLTTYLSAAELDTAGIDLSMENEMTCALFIDDVPWRVVERRFFYIQSQIGLWEVVLRT